MDLHARAFTYGNHIAFAPGEYDTDTSAGKHLLAHELGHVLQQRGQPGREVNATWRCIPYKGRPAVAERRPEKAAIAHDTLRFKGVPPKIMQSARYRGVRRDAAALDDVFVNAIAAWQNWWNLPSMAG
jgi:hypothetical protein